MENQVLANIIGYIAAIIGATMFVPQAVTIWKTKETKGISLLSFSLLGIVSLLWFVYGLLLEAIPIIMVNAIIGLLCVFIISMKLKYK